MDEYLESLYEDRYSDLAEYDERDFWSPSYYDDEYDEPEPVICPACGDAFTTWNHFDNHDCPELSPSV